MNQFQDDYILPVDLFSDWHQDEFNEASEKESNMINQDVDVHDSASEEVPASADGSSQILSQLTLLACNTKAQTANTEKVQRRMMKAVQTIERQQKENQELRMENARLFEQLAITRKQRYGDNFQTIEKEPKEHDHFKNVYTISDRPDVDVMSQKQTKIDELSSIGVFPLEVHQNSATSNESSTLFRRPSHEHEEKPNHIFSLLKQHSETFPIVDSILSATTLMEFRLSEMETMLCNMESRWTRSKTKIDGLEIRGDNFIPLDKASKDFLGDSKESEFRIRAINDITVGCLQVEGSDQYTNSAATLHDNTCSKIPSPSVLSQISCTIMEAGSTLKEAVLILGTVLDNLETLCESSTESRAVDVHATNGDKSDLVMLECPLVVDVNVASNKAASEKQDDRFDVFDEIEVENTRLKSSFEHQVIRQVQQDTLFLQKLDHNERLVLACTAALKVASNLEEIIHGFESCPFDHDDENHTETMRIQINELQEQQQILTEQLCTLQFEHDECKEKLQHIQAENLGLNKELKEKDSCFNLLQINVTLDLDKVTSAFEHQMSEIDSQLCLQTERIRGKLQQNEMLLVSKEKQIDELGKEFQDLSVKSQRDTVVLMQMKKDLVQSQNSFAAAVEQNEMQASSLQTAITNARAGEEKLNFLQSKLELCERNASQAVECISKDCKKFQLRNENILAIFLLCFSVLVHCITQGWSLD